MLNARGLSIVVIAMLALMAGGCAEPGARPGATVEDRAPGGGDGSGAASGGGASQGVTVSQLPGDGRDGRTGEGTGEGTGLAAGGLRRQIFFAFDSDAIDAENRAVVERHVGALRTRTRADLTLEGHTDERGTREYNLALGERRAMAVERLLKTLGISAERIRVVSYGEEKPAMAGQTEEAWSRSRRVEILY